MIHELRYLWATRKTSGFPWPSWRGIDGRLSWHMAVFGSPRWSPMPLRRKIARIPLRPWLYYRRVIAVAHTRSFPYRHSDNDSVA